MNSQKVNMYVGTLIGSLLFFLLLGFFSELIFVGRGHPEHAALAFAIEIEVEVEDAEEATVDYAALIAAADLAKGEKVFGKCKACHKLTDGKNGVGPFLWGVVGRPIGSAPGFKYSSGIASHGGDWSLDNLLGFLEAPKTWSPGTKMAFKGLPRIEDRINVIVYLNQADGSPVELAAATASESPDTEVAATAEPAAQTDAEPAAEPETVATATGGEPEAPDAASGGEDYAELLATADAGAGEKIFRKCRACHKLEDGKNGIGPSLWGVIGRDIASAEGFKYSDAMKGQEGNWSGAKLFIYLENPRGVVPGTKMKFPGLKDAHDRINVITYLNQADGTPEPLTE